MTTHVPSVGVRYGLKGSIIVPTNVNPGKRRKLEGVGASLLLHGEDCVETELEGRWAQLCTVSRRMAETPGVQFIPPYNDPDVMAGQGTLALEVPSWWHHAPPQILEQVPEVEVLVVSVGGGGLMAGVAAYAKTGEGDR